MARRSVGEINAGSMADIAFLLLIFFLVTTTMNVDTGITRRLPPPVIDEEIKPIKERNIFTVLVNSADQLLVNGQRGNLRTLRQEAKDFLRVNYSNDPNFPETTVKSIPLLDANKDWAVSKGVISLQNDRGTSYDMYIQVQNELTAAVNDLRDELSMLKFQRKFSVLDHKKPNDKAKIDAIKDAVPVSISEAEPKDVGGTE